MPESDIIRWICAHPVKDRRVLVGPGDDAAVLAFPGTETRLVFASDAIAQGTHFRIEDGLAAAGRKALLENLSDLAAMGAEPLACVCSVSVPAGAGEAPLRDLYDGLAAAAERWRCPLVGGDVISGSAEWVIDVSVTGTVDGNPFLRRGATPGDAIFVTGALGGSLESGRHLDFTPRFEEARLLRRLGGIHACLDISDGLSTDLNHLADASGAGFLIDAAKVPVSEAARRASAAGGRSALERALHDGEDFELCFSYVGVRADQLAAAWPFKDVPLTRIGSMTEASQGRLITMPDGSRKPLPPGGFEHSL
jgi:thiamine-monophosphate kinase